MSNENNISRWSKLPSFPDEIKYGDMTSINDHEFVLATPSDTQNQCQGIYKYNHRINEWTKLIKYPTDFKTTWQKIAFNQNEQKLYAYDENAQLTTFDFHSKQIHIQSNCSVTNINGHCLINANGSIHLIGGGRNTKHLKWDNQTNKFECIHDFNNEYLQIIYSSAVYVKSKNIIVLFGGFSNLVQVFGGYATSEILNDILIYSLDSNTWSKAECVNGVNLWGMRSTITLDEKHIIICGGITADDQNVDDIWILDILENDKYKLRKSNICAPKPACHHIARTGGLSDKILVFGYIRQFFDSMKLRLMPGYLMDVISIWYSVEEIHWIERNGTDHYGIAVKEILGSMHK